MALSQILIKAGPPKDRPLTSAELTRLGDEISKIDPETFEAFAAKYPGDSGGVPKEFIEALQQFKEGTLTSSTTTPPAPAPAPAPTPNPAGEAGGNQDDKPESGKEGGSDLDIVDADANVSKDEGGDINPRFSGQIINASWSHTQGDKVKLDILVFIDNRPVQLIRGMKAVVLGRRPYPYSAKTEAEATLWVVSYRVEKRVYLKKFDIVVPGRTPTDDMVVRARLLTNRQHGFDGQTNASTDRGNQEVSPPPSRPELP